MAAKHFSSLNNPQLIELIKSGGIGVIPTDTVYGLVAAAQQPTAVERLYGVKPRDPSRSRSHESRR